MKHIEKLRVEYNGQEVGMLHLGEKGKIYFSYDTQWLSDGFNISPFDLKMIPELQAAKDPLFGGLHGVFADSISDGWGLMLTDRALQKKFNWEKNSITQLDRLFFIGSRPMGGLEYYPQDKIEHKLEKFNLESIFNETQKILTGEKEEIIQELFLSGGSPGGARPKAVFARQGNKLITGYSQLLEGYKGWIVKFFSSIDSNSIGKIEKAYADMAKACGIHMPNTELIHVKIDGKSRSFFATERFDRQTQHKIHVASLSGLVYASHRIPSISYQDIFNITNSLCKNQVETEKLACIMLFNVLAHNQDDHSKNFSYQYVDNKWQFTPAYDLVYSVGPGGEHMSDIGGNGKPTIEDIKKLSQQFDLKNINEKIEQTSDVVNRWKTFAEPYDISKREVNDIEKSLQQKLKDFSQSKIIKMKNN